MFHAETAVRSGCCRCNGRGVASEKPDSDEMCRQLGSPRALDLTGRATLTELLHLFDLAEVLVTNDSGPAHFAALTRIHVIVFFGPEIPERYRPLASSSDVIHTGYSCSPCIGPHNQRLSPCNDNLCMKSINGSRRLHAGPVLSTRVSAPQNEERLSRRAPFPG